MRHFFITALLMIALPLIVLGGDKKETIRSTVRSTDGVELPRPASTNAVVKWEETFNSTTVPAGWRTIDNDGSGTTWTYRQLVTFTSGDTIKPQAGLSFWFASFSGANAQGRIDEYLISPKLPLVVVGDSLHFYAGAIGGMYPDSFRVKISTTDSALASFTTQIAYFRVDGPTGSWHRYSMSLSQFAGQRIFVAVNYYIVDGGPSGSSSDNVWLDHFIHTGLVAASVGEQGVLPSAFTVGKNYPNPFNPTTTIDFQMQKGSNVKLAVYNLIGQKIRTLVSGYHSVGLHSAVWDGRNDEGDPAVSGVYFYRFDADGFVNTQRMVLLK